MRFGGDEFEGPFASPSALRNLAGIYLVRCSGGAVLALGEASEVRAALEQHDEARCWEANRDGALEFWIYYTPYMSSLARHEIERELRAVLQPKC